MIHFQGLTLGEDCTAIVTVGFLRSSGQTPLAVIEEVDPHSTCSPDLSRVGTTHEDIAEDKSPSEHKIVNLNLHTVRT